MFTKRLEELSEVMNKCIYSSTDREVTQNQALQIFHSFLLQTKENDGTVFVVGNGGSAGIASHFSIDLLNALKIPSQTLYDSNVMTCISNDYGYDQVFSRPLDLLLKRNDLLVCVSSSGNSQNILNAAAIAKSKDIPIITLSGFEPHNPLRNLGDLNLYLPIIDYGLVEMGHFFLLHTIIDSWNFNPSINKTADSLSHAK
ncbi:MAG: SIS domain-containing protein [Chlamydiales bacterium]|nr:SIS domain-containing protein [Chlamydiia bacterium]MCP5503943.1 SIS domain-containing protein [Chlamydiales bacterium]